MSIMDLYIKIKYRFLKRDFYIECGEVVYLNESV